MERINVWVIHGVGNQPEDFDRERKNKLRGQLGGQTFDRVNCRSAHWAPMLQVRSAELGENTKDQLGLDLVDNGDGSGTARDGVLQSGEVDATDKICL